jgi:lipoprotein-anchoring transpeptidase ErfK/SrfK
LSGLEARGKMRSLLIAATTVMLFAAGAAQAKVSVTIDKDAQMMTVAVDGVERYHWPVSTGIPSRETPNGSFRAFRMEEEHYSKEFDDAPMPHSIFFTKIGHAPPPPMAACGCRRPMPPRCTRW